MTKLNRRVVLAALATAPIAMRAHAAGHAANHEVSIQGFAFSPASIEVNAGDTITFTNVDGAPHTATAMDGSFDTGRLNRNESATITVEAAGTHEYQCAFHPNMRGTVTAS